MLTRLDTPLGRAVGALLSWASFAFFFVGLYQGAAALAQLGGSCASGGPYAIETQCTGAVMVFVPLGIFGFFLSHGLALILARGFGVSLIAWGWPILFTGLGIGFFADATAGQGLVANVIVGALFVVMGLAPGWFVVSGRAIVPTLVGSRSILGERFVYEGTARRYFGLKPTEGREEAVPTGRDWAISLGFWLASVALGTWLSLLAFAALAATG